MTAVLLACVLLVAVPATASGAGERATDAAAATSHVAAGGVVDVQVRGHAAARPGARASHRCSRGYRHAVTPGGHKCLREGQYCSRKRGYARAYKRAGFVCKGGRLRHR